MEKRRFRNYIRKWEDLSVTQKRHYLFRFITLNRFRFWKICGKDLQHHYQYAPANEDTLDELRESIFNDYITAVKNSDYVGDKEKLIKKATEYLFGKENN